MKYRILFCVHSLISLISGGFIYLIFRQKTYIHTFLLMENGFFASTRFAGDNFIKYLLPDFLWAYSLSMLLYAVLLPKKSSSKNVLFLVIFLGILWELLQKLLVVSGTSDYLDCLMYIIAAIVSNIIYLRKRSRKK